MENFDWQELWEKGKAPIIFGLIGVFLVSVGILAMLLFYQQKEPEIEIVSSKEEGTVWVDLVGAVMNPGVYELPNGSRIKDLLARAGGLSAQADREWIEKNMNLALKLNDGQKVYVPKQGERVEGQEGERIGQVAGVSEKININTASASELDTLWGIGEVRAKAIIENRPYTLIDELLTKKIIPKNVFEKIKEEISVY